MNLNTARNTRIDWGNSAFLILTPLIALVFTILHLIHEGWNPAIWVAFLILQAFVGLSVTGGYHRLFAHRAYSAKPWVRLFYLVFGAASFQNSALKWCMDHRRHHRFVDQDEDPYSIQKGFFHAHMGWVMTQSDRPEEVPPKDLREDALVMWQHRNYLLIAVLAGILAPALLGWALGAPLGGIGVLAFGRIVFLHHCTFFINSACHYFGKAPYSDQNSAKDSTLLAFFTMGEGYHNFHHAFQADYRNGIRWYHWDPTKWTIQSLRLLGWADQLKRTPEAKILKARLLMEEKQIQSRLTARPFSIKLPSSSDLREQVLQAQKRWLELKSEYRRAKQELGERGRQGLSELSEQHRQRVADLRLRIATARAEFHAAYALWQGYLRSSRIAAR